MCQSRLVQILPEQTHAPSRMGTRKPCRHIMASLPSMLRQGTLSPARLVGTLCRRARAEFSRCDPLFSIWPPPMCSQRCPRRVCSRRTRWSATVVEVTKRLGKACRHWGLLQSDSVGVATCYARPSCRYLTLLPGVVFHGQRRRRV